MDSIVSLLYLLVDLSALVFALRRILRVRGWLQALGGAGVTMLFPAVLLLLLIGLEELLGSAIVPERIALVAVALTALHLVAVAGFVIFWATRRRRPSDN